MRKKSKRRKRRKSCKPFRRISRKRRRMSGGAPPVPLAPGDWSHSEGGEIVNGVLGMIPTSSHHAYFKHARELQGGDLWRMRVGGGGRSACVGFAAEGYDIERDGETYKSIAVVSLFDGSTIVRSDISRDGQQHYHDDHLKDNIPNIPNDVALRINKDGNVPQIQFNDDDVWHNFVPGGVALKAGPWFPFIQLYDDDTTVGAHSVGRPKPTKSAGKTGPNKDAKTAKTAKAAPPASSNAQKTRANGRSKSVAPSRPKIVKSPKIANTP